MRIPGGSKRILNTPTSSDNVSRETPVSMFVTSTLAPGTTALVASVTVPFMSPEDTSACGNAAKANTMIAKIARPVASIAP